MEMLQGVWKQHLRPRAVVGYGVKISLPSPPNYVTRSPGYLFCVTVKRHQIWIYDILDLFRCHLLGLSFVSRASKNET